MSVPKPPRADPDQRASSWWFGEIGGGVCPIDDYQKGTAMIVLGVILIILGALLDIGILYTIGGILAVVGIILWLLGAMGRQIGPRAHYY